MCVHWLQEEGLGGWVGAHSCFFFLPSSQQGIVGKQAQRRCWSITDRGAVMFGCQATGREKQAQEQQSVRRVGVVSAFSPPSIPAPPPEHGGACDSIYWLGNMWRHEEVHQTSSFIFYKLTYSLRHFVWPSVAIEMIYHYYDDLFH